MLKPIVHDSGEHTSKWCPLLAGRWCMREECELWLWYDVNQTGCCAIAALGMKALGVKFKVKGVKL